MALIIQIHSLIFLFIENFPPVSLASCLDQDDDDADEWFCMYEKTRFRFTFTLVFRADIFVSCGTAPVASAYERQWCVTRSHSLFPLIPTPTPPPPITHNRALLPYKSVGFIIISQQRR